MTLPKILAVLTSTGTLGDSGMPTGWYLPEFAHPYNILAPHAEIVVASPAGGAAPLDPSSVEAFKSDPQCVGFLNTQTALWKNTQKLSDFLGRAGEFHAIYFVGGHGPMFDLATSSVSHQLVNEFWSAGKVVSAVCHGSAALAFIRTANGTSLLAGSEVTGFSNAEEDAIQLGEAVPFKLEDKLSKASGGHYVKADSLWGVKIAVARDGRLITGQNPASAAAVGEAILKSIRS
ncbi:hypothetical protein OIDMADRAFT_59526 [Oidiodendron maius Zn]|uniref:D-lactate dehydratase n=1 Tax=Oidiodendron maius (strain Zn) TaxID=913774 RepID=A0A0C3GZS5_OIDMZ|nr:hypothetical protein OIDMADRAFT_59526 [Oidiodendron maius Zn]